MFEDVKKGDYVLCLIGLRQGFSAQRQFKIKKEVERVTLRQFIVNGSRYRKDNGLEVGGGGRCYLFFSDDDQTEEAEHFVRTRKIMSEISDCIYDLYMVRNRINPDVENLDEILSDLHKLKKKIGAEYV